MVLKRWKNTVEKRQKFKFQLYCSGISGNVDSVGLGLAWQQTYWSLPDTCFDNFHVSRQRTQWSPNFALHIWISISNTGFPDTCFDNFQVLCPCLLSRSEHFHILFQTPASSISRFPQFQTCSCPLSGSVHFHILIPDNERNGHLKQACKTRRCDSYLQSENINHWQG